MILNMNKQSIYLKMIYLTILYYFILYSLTGVNYASAIGTVFLSSNQSVIEKGEECEITVNLENNKTAAFDIKIYFDNAKLEFVSGPKNVNVIDNRIIYVWYDETGRKWSKRREFSKF